MPDQPALAVEHGHVQRDGARRPAPRRRCARPAGPRHPQGPARWRVPPPPYWPPQLRKRRPGWRGPPCPPTRACCAGSSRPWASLAILAIPPAIVSRGTGWRRKVAQQAADEIPHLDQRHLRQTMQRRHRRLAGAAGRSSDVADPGGAGHVDAAMDGVDPGGAGIRHDHAGGAQDGQAADDAQACRSACALPASGAVRGWTSSTTASAPGATSARAARIICARHRVDGRLARRQRQAGRWLTVPMPSPARNTTPLPGAPRRTWARDQGAMRHIRVVAGVLHHARGMGAVLP